MKFNMKAIILVLLLLSLVTEASDVEKPNPIQKYLQFKALKPNFQTIEYFSIDTLPDYLKGKQWYAFVLINLPQNYFVETFSVEIYTVSKETGAQSQRKVLCDAKGDHLSDCFIGSDRIDPTQELIVVKVSFMEQMTGTIKMQISGVKDVKINESIVLYQGQKNYTKIVRLSIKEYEEEFNFLYCEFKQKSLSSFQEMYYFSAAYAQTPPDKNRYDKVSSSLWGEHQQIVFPFQEIKQMELITMTLQTIGLGVYNFHCSAIRPQNETLQLSLEAPLYDIVDRRRTYHLSLPLARSNTTLYCIYLDIPFRIRFDITDVEINHRLLNKAQTRKALLTTDAQILPGIFKLWLNSTIEDVKFKVNFQIVNFITITVTKYDLSLIELEEGKVWDDRLVINQTQHLYFTIDKNTGQQPVNFQVFINSRSRMRGLAIKFFNCVDKSPQKCKEDLYSPNKTLKTIAFVEIKPKIEITPSRVEYQFKDLHVSSMQTNQGKYQSIIVVEISAVEDSTYFIAWKSTHNIQKLSQNAVTRGTIAEDDAKIYYFSVSDATNVSFARVNFLPEGQAIIFGSNQLLDLKNMNTFQQENVTIHHVFDNSVHFPHLESRNKYYLYIIGKERCNYRLMLTFGYEMDANSNHTVTFMTVGEQSKNHMLMQPGEVAFIEIKIANLWTIFHVQNSLPLRMCIIERQQAPISHQDLLESQECSDIRISTALQLFRLSEPDRLFVGLQNKQTIPVAATLTTQRQLADCFPELLGQRHSLTLNQDRSEGCVMYQIRQKTEIEVSTNLHNAKLEGFAYPVIHIGEELKISMTSSYKVFSPEEIEQACNAMYQGCFIEIKIQALRANGNDKDDVNEKMRLITVFAGQTDKPLLLPDGIGHQSHLKQKLPLHFKYIIRTAQPVTVSLKADPRQIYKIYASMASISYKLAYPNSSRFDSYIQSPNSTDEILRSDQNKYIGFTYLKVPTEMIQRHCELGYECFLLLTVECEKCIVRQFTIQATQNIYNLNMGVVEKSFLREGEVAFYHVDPMNSARLLVLLSSHGEMCHSMSISKGADPFSNVLVKDKSSQLQVSPSKNTIYTVTVTASTDCYYSIQATSTSIQIKEITYGFSQKFHLKRSQKDYFMIKIQNQQVVKVIGSIGKDIPGEIILRAYAVQQQKMQSFVALISDKAQFQQKGLEYGWTDRNHLVLHHTDKHYCRYCLVFLQVESIQQSSGFLSLAFDKLQSTYVTYQSTMYDILLKDQSFVWMFRYSSIYHSYQIHLQVGTLSIEVFYDDSLKQKKQIRFNDVANGSFSYSTSEDLYGKYIRFKVTAKENSDYSLAIIRSNTNPEENQPSKRQDTYNSIQMGRPKRIYLSSLMPSYCLKGTITDLHQKFMFSLVNIKYKSSKKDSNQLAKQFKQQLQIKATINDKPAEMDIELVKSTFLMSFKEKVLENTEHPFTICLMYNSTTAVNIEFIFIGNLNYFPQNQPYHIKGQQNLTFMSEGRGFIEVDECQRRATLILTRKYSDLDKHKSTISQRRIANHLVEFSHTSSAYLRIQSQDYTSLRWRNLHSQTYNGYGYQFYAASSFRINEDKNKRISLTIKPLSVIEQDKNKLPEIVSMVYHIYIAPQEGGLYNAMNCERGKYMHWIRDVARDERDREVQFLLNNVEDLIATFKKESYVLVIVKTEIELQWKNGLIQQYRFYYPYQELMLHKQQRSEIEEVKPPEEKQEEEQEGGSVIVWVLLAVVAIALVGGVAAWSMRRPSNQSFLVEESAGGSEINAVELQKVGKQRS